MVNFKTLQLSIDYKKWFRVSKNYETKTLEKNKTGSGVQSVLKAY